MVVGAWSMAEALWQLFEYYYYQEVWLGKVLQPVYYRHMHDSIWVSMVVLLVKGSQEIEILGSCMKYHPDHIPQSQYQDSQETTIMRKTLNYQINKTTASYHWLL